MDRLVYKLSNLCWEFPLVKYHSVKPSGVTLLFLCPGDAMVTEPHISPMRGYLFQEDRVHGQGKKETRVQDPAAG